MTEEFAEYKAGGKGIIKGFNEYKPIEEKVFIGTIDRDERTNTIILNALIQLLVKKGIITKNELNKFIKER